MDPPPPPTPPQVRSAASHHGNKTDSVFAAVLGGRREPVPGGRRSWVTDLAGLTGAAIFFSLTAALTVSIVPRLGIEPFIAEWRTWALVLAAALLTPCVTWAANRGRGSLQRVLLYAAATSGATLALVGAVVAWSFYDVKLSAGMLPAGSWWAWGLLLLALVLASWRATKEPQRDPPDGPRRSWLSADTFVLGSAGLCLLTLLVTAGPFVSVQRGARCGFDLAAVREAMDYLKDNSAKGDIVFTDDWDVFGLYFYHNHHNRYIVGLDPEFTNARDPVLWKRYVAITRAQTPTTVNAPADELKDGAANHSEPPPAAARKDNQQNSRKTKKLPVRLTDIREYFKARWVIVDHDHRALAGKLDAAPNLAKRVHTVPSNAKPGRESYIIYRILPG